MGRAKIGDIEISVVSSESLINKAIVTNKSVEKGEDVADHVKKIPHTIELVGAVVGDDASDKLNKLKKLQEQGTLVKYVHRNALTNMIIEDISSVHETKIRNGFSFNIILKHVKIAQSKEIEIKIANPNPKSNTQVKPETSNGLQQVQDKPIVSSLKENLISTAYLSMDIDTYIRNLNSRQPRNIRNEDMPV